METNSKEKIGKTISYLNHLAEIHNDRIIGFEKAISEIDDDDLVLLFTNMAAHSRSFKTDLIKSISFLGGEYIPLSEYSGKFRNAWMDFESALNRKVKEEILKSCEAGEDLTLNTYEVILSEGDNALNMDMRRLIEIQKQELQEIYDRLHFLKNTIGLYKN